jgi:hypothetical protein
MMEVVGQAQSDGGFRGTLHLLDASVLLREGATKETRGEPVQRRGPSHVIDNWSGRPCRIARAGTPSGRSRGDRPLDRSRGLQLDHRARRIHRRSACAVWSPLPRRHLMERLSQTLAHEVLGQGRLLFPIQGSRGSRREALKNFCARSQEDLKTCFSTPRSCRPRADSHLILSFTGQGYPWPVYWLQTDRHRFDQGQSATARRSILRHFICKRPDCAPAACSSPKERRVYGASSLILVAQFPRDVRVPPQEPIAPVRYSANVHV